MMREHRSIAPPQLELYRRKLPHWRTEEATYFCHLAPGQELHEFLGMSKDEYGLWLRNPDALSEIGRARRERS